MVQRVGGRMGSPHHLGIYHSFSKFWEFFLNHFSLYTIAPHKKFASAHPPSWKPFSCCLRSTKKNQIPGTLIKYSLVLTRPLLLYSI